MQISYRRDVHHNYLILSGDDQTDMTSYQIRMMMANEMDGLLSCKVHQMDQKMLFYYDITSKQPLQTLLEHQLIQKDTLELLLSQIAVVMETVREYLLSLDGLVLKPEMIYLDAERRRIWFCYYPGNQLPFQAQLRELSEYLLPKLEHKDRDAVMLGYIFYQKCVEETVTTDVFQELLHRVTASQSREDAAQEIPEIIGQENMIDQQDEIPKNREELLESFFEPEEKEERRPLNLNQKRLLISGAVGLAGLLAGFTAMGLPAEGGVLAAAAAGIYLLTRTVRKNLQENREREAEMEKYLQVSWDSEEYQTDEEESLTHRGTETSETLAEETVYLGEEASENGNGKRKAWLFPENPPGGEPVMLEKEMCLVGKGKGTADVLLESPAVSRLHARLLWDGETFCISDLNSRNGTYVNGRLLSAGESCVLISGDRIRFADLTYCFRK